MEIAQSAVILRYLAKKHGLEAKTVKEQAVCDMYAEYIQDFIMNIRPWIWTITKNSSEEEKQEKFNNLFVPQVTENFGPIFQKQLEKSGTGYLVGELTWADFMLAEWSDKIVTVGKSDILDNFPKILEHRNKILLLPNLQEYLKNRTDNKF
uniref:Glutathione S-transferase n=1 Tax=Acrobeloides nanus TaxID=290746 RepID=A0A914EEV2_9BILA